ncbi:hypothetical protein ABIB89_003164 [Bradyrhizobium sp. JR3.12]
MSEDTSDIDHAMWLLRRRSNHAQFWSTLDGWTDRDHATRYREDEVNTVSLTELGTHTDGEWRRADQ